MGRKLSTKIKHAERVAIQTMAEETDNKWWRANDELREKGNVINENGRDRHVGASPYMRWKANNQLTEAQQAAIAYCLRLWDLCGVKGPPCTAAYGERIPGGNRPEPQWLAAKIIDAQRDLARVEGHFDGIRTYWQVFENCIRYDEPAGRAGSRIMGWDGDRTNTRVLTVVQFVADMIAVKEGLT